MVDYSCNDLPTGVGLGVISSYSETLPDTMFVKRFHNFGFRSTRKSTSLPKVYSCKRVYIQHWL